MAGRVWQGLGVSASFPASPLTHCLSHHTGCDNSHSSPDPLLSCMRRREPRLWADSGILTQIPAPPSPQQSA